MKTNKIDSRTTEINNDLCVTNVGENRFDLVLIAAVRAREISRQTKNQMIQGPYKNTCVSALLDIQEGRVTRDHLKRI